MKLIYCRHCQDVVRLMVGQVRCCKCGACAGRALDSFSAEYSGQLAVPFGITNGSIEEALRLERSWSGTQGVPIDAFLIPKNCKAIRRVETLGVPNRKDH